MRLRASGGLAADVSDVPSGSAKWPRAGPAEAAASPLGHIEGECPQFGPCLRRRWQGGRFPLAPPRPSPRYALRQTEMQRPSPLCKKRAQGLVASRICPAAAGSDRGQ